MPEHANDDAANALRRHLQSKLLDACQRDTLDESLLGEKE